MEFLKREGLYSPQVKEMRTDDPVATDLIGALLTVFFFRSLKKKTTTFLLQILKINSGLIFVCGICSKGQQIQCRHVVAQMIPSFVRQIAKIPCYYH